MVDFFILNNPVDQDVSDSESDDSYDRYYEWTKHYLKTTWGDVGSLESPPQEMKSFDDVWLGEEVNLRYAFILQQHHAALAQSYAEYEMERINQFAWRYESVQIRPETLTLGQIARNFFDFDLPSPQHVHPVFAPGVILLDGVWDLPLLQTWLVFSQFYADETSDCNPAQAVVNAFDRLNPLSPFFEGSPSGDQRQYTDIRTRYGSDQLIWSMTKTEWPIVSYNAGFVAEYFIPGR